MGRLALLVVTALVLGTSVTYFASERQSFEQIAEESEYEYQVLAREIAQSGFNIAMGDLRSDFESHRGDWNDVSYHQGQYSISVSGPAAGPVALTVLGEIGGKGYRITTSVERSTSRVLDGLVTDGAVKKFEFKNRAHLSGMDTNPDGSDGPNVDVHAALATDASAAATMTSSLSPGDAPGVDGDPDVYFGSPEVDLTALSQSILDYSGPNRYYYDDKVELKEQTIGSPANPAVVIVEGETKLGKNFVGYGVLYVGGKFKMEKNARWEGLVVAERNGGKHEFKDDAQIYGSLVLRTIATTPEDQGDGDGDNGFPGGHFDIDVYDEPDATNERYHEHRYDDDYDVTGVDLLNPTGCESNGGLCWDEIMSSAGPVFVEFLNPVRGAGTYTINAGGAVFYGKTIDPVAATGNVHDGLAAPILMAASEMTTFKIDLLALCALEISSPGASIEDAFNRNGAFAVRMFEARSTGSTWSRGDLMYELGVYHHTGYGMWVNEGGEVCDPFGLVGGGETITANGEDMEIKLSGDALIQYSSVALGRISGVLPALVMQNGSIATGDVREYVEY